MSKRLFQNIFLLILVNLLIKPLWIFGIDLPVQNSVGEQEYGIYFILFNFSFLFHILLDLGINQFNNNEIASKNEKIGQLYGQLFYIKIALAAFYLLCTFILAFVFDFSSRYVSLLLFFTANQIFLSFILFARSNFTALEWNGYDRFFSIFDRSISIIVLALIIYTHLLPTISIELFVMIQTGSLFLSALLSNFIVFMQSKIKFPKLQLDYIQSLLKQSLPYAIVVLLMTFYTRIDTLMLDQLLPSTGQEEAGVYAAAYRLLDAVNMIPFLLTSLLIPFFAKQWQAKKAVDDVLKTAVQWMIMISWPFVLLIYFFHEQILTLLYVDSNATWYPSFQLLLFTFPMVFLGYIFGGYLTGTRQLKWISYFAIFTILVNLLANYLLIPRYGAFGAAIATLIAQSIMALLQFIKAQQITKTKWTWAWLLKLVLYAALVLVSILILNIVDLNWLIKIALFTFLSIILSVVLRLFNIKDLISIQSSSYES